MSRPTLLLFRVRALVSEHPWPVWLLFIVLLRMMERGLAG